MGQPIVVNEKPSAANRGVIRFETSRMLTGMGHERYRAGDVIQGHRPPDELARRLLELDSVAGLHVHGNMITVDLNRGYEADGVRAVIEDLYVFYPENLVNPEDAEAAASPVDDAPVEIEAGADPSGTGTADEASAPEVEAGTTAVEAGSDEIPADDGATEPEAEDETAAPEADAEAAD